jgi:Ni,Fe-hydrogenase I large subunit
MKKVTIKKLIEKIEGEAELDFVFNNEKIEDVKISFGFRRGIEDILIGRNFQDSLVITPKVCGICNHAHLLSAVKAIEDGYRKSGLKVELSNKAKFLREFTLSCELIQNHIKWLYFNIFPQLEKYLKIQNKENYGLKATFLSTTITKALAIFAGQWPHSSYAIPGGITCDPMQLDITQAQSLIDKSIGFFEDVVVGIPLEKYLEIDSTASISHIKGDLAKILNLLIKNNMADIGKSYDRFIAFENFSFSSLGKSIATNISSIDYNHIKEESQKNTLAKAVKYKNRLYETGPLARAMVSKIPIIKSLHKQHKDSILSRIFARVHEISLLLNNANKLLKSINIKEESCTLPLDTKINNFEGVGIVEAARGSLVHKTIVENGNIKKYEIITPTQWNLSCGDSKEKGIAINAMIDSLSVEEATFILRSFDVCSVCTTQ